MPLISAATQARREGYFRLEWKLAAQRTHMISERQSFLFQVVIDSTTDAAADVPEEFRAVQWTRLPGGEHAEKFGARVKNLLGGSGVGRVSDPALPAAGASRAGQRPALPSKHRFPSAAWVALVVVALAGGALVFWPKLKTPAPAAATAAD